MERAQNQPWMDGVLLRQRGSSAARRRWPAFPHRKRAGKHGQCVTDLKTADDANGFAAIHYSVEPRKAALDRCATVLAISAISVGWEGFGPVLHLELLGYAL